MRSTDETGRQADRHQAQVQTADSTTHRGWSLLLPQRLHVREHVRAGELGEGVHVLDGAVHDVRHASGNDVLVRRLQRKHALRRVVHHRDRDNAVAACTRRTAVTTTTKMTV
jgi:hypothetical protein